MKKKIWLPLGLVIAVLLLLVIAAKASAWTQFRTGDNATVLKGETIDSTLWSGAKNVEIAGIINGDVFCAGQTVVISGTVKGDVICAAQDFRISGRIDGSLRLAAQTASISGQIGRNATIAAQTIYTDSAAKIAGDASFAAQKINHNGFIGRDLAVAGADEAININGGVGRDIKGTADQITLGSRAKVGGSIDYTSANKLTMDHGATVTGSIEQHYPKQAHRSYFKLLIFAGGAAIFAGLILLLSAVLLTALLPQFVHSVSTQAIRRPWRALLTGLIAGFVIPALAVLLMITVVGIPLGILLLICFGLVAMSSGLFTAYYVGRRVWRRQTNPVWRVLAGGAILLILCAIPLFGFLVVIVSFWLGLGMVLLELKNRRPKPKYVLK